MEQFYLTDAEWIEARDRLDYDLIIIGTGFCALSVAFKSLEIDPFCKILMIERGIAPFKAHIHDSVDAPPDASGTPIETFPWVLSTKTTAGQFGDNLRWQHGIFPFFGGRSTLWSAWCPRPKIHEMFDWPKETIEAMMRNLEQAEKMLHVHSTDQLALLESRRKFPKLTAVDKAVFGKLQRFVGARIESVPITVESIYSAEAARFAFAEDPSLDAAKRKFVVSYKLNSLVAKQRLLSEKGQGADLHIILNCTVEKIKQDDGAATTLSTSRGDVSIGNADLILANSTLPITSLAQNAFPEEKFGDRFSAHFQSYIVARIPAWCFDVHDALENFEIGAFYLSGKCGDYSKQFHIQLNCIFDREPIKGGEDHRRYSEEILSVFSEQQLNSSNGFVVFACSVLGELDANNKNNWYRRQSGGKNDQTLSTLQFSANKRDLETWDCMDEATYSVLENTLAPTFRDRIQYWHGSPNSGYWRSKRAGRRFNALVHESSTLPIGESDTSMVDLNYRLRSSKNVYITGGALWPRGGSWNPTLGMVALAIDLAVFLMSKKNRSL